MKKSINNLGSVGFISPEDRRPYEIPPEGFSGGANMRTRDGAVEEVKGWQDIFDPPIDVYWADWMDNGTDRWWVLFGDLGLAYSYDGATYTQIGGPHTHDVNTDLYVTTKLNGILVYTNGEVAPKAICNGLGLETPLTNFVDLPDWPADWTCKGIIAHKNFLIAYNMADAGVLHPNKVVWSDAAAPGFLPGDSDGDCDGDGSGWVATPDNFAGEITLGAGSGSIIAAELLRDDVILYTETETWRMTFVGGQEVYAVERIFRNRGAFGARMVKEFEGRHYVLTEDGFVAHDGQQSVNLAEGRVWDYLKQYLTTEVRHWGYLYLDWELDEVGVCYHQFPGSEYAPDQRLIYNFHTNTWSTPAEIPGLYFIKPLPQMDFTPGEVVVWDADPAITPDDSWDTGPDIPAAVTGDTLLSEFKLYGGGYPVSQETGRGLFLLETGYEYRWSGHGGPTYPHGWFRVEKDDVNLTDDESTSMIREIYPKLHSNGPVNIYVGSKMSLEDPVVWEGPFAFDPDTMHRITCRVVGRRHALAAETSDGSPFRLFGLDVGFVPTGQY